MLKHSFVKCLLYAGKYLGLTFVLRSNNMREARSSRDSTSKPVKIYFYLSTGNFCKTSFSHSLLASPIAQSSDEHQVRLQLGAEGGRGVCSRS